MKASILDAPFKHSAASTRATALVSFRLKLTGITEFIALTMMSVRSLPDGEASDDWTLGKQWMRNNCREMLEIGYTHKLAANLPLYSGILPK